MYHPVIALASARSAWRGLDYYREGRVLTCEQENEEWINGTVLGSAEEPYQVHLSLEHPRKSTCNCPHAKDRLVVCKHKVALFFQAVPGADAEFLEEVELERIAYNLESERERRERHREIVQYVKGLTKEQLQKELIKALEDLDERDDNDWW